MYLRVASILDVLVSPRYFSRFTRVKRFVCREPPNKFWKREPPSLLKGVPNVFVVESSVVIGF